MGARNQLASGVPITGSRGCESCAVSRSSLLAADVRHGANGISKHATTSPRVSVVVKNADGDLAWLAKTLLESYHQRRTVAGRFSWRVATIQMEFVRKAPEDVLDEVLARVRAIIDSDDVVEEITPALQ